ncbi:unnamed protein product [Leuciscus chuanchicus]
MCIDIHKQLSDLVAVGLNNGCVAVYSLLEKSKQPIYNSTASSGKHKGIPVMQVKWQEDDLDSNHNFISVSADGRVVSWTLREPLTHLILFIFLFGSAGVAEWAGESPPINSSDVHFLRTGTLSRLEGNIRHSMSRATWMLDTMGTSVSVDSPVAEMESSHH